METTNNGMRDRDDSRSDYKDRGEGTEETPETNIGATDRDSSGRDITDEGRDERSHHQQFGNRKYESNRNHSSADDIASTDTGA